MNLKVLSILAFAASVVGLALLLMRKGLLSPAPLVIAVQVTAVLLMVWARITFGRRSFHAAANTTDGGLVTNGPYRFVRHPIYAAILLFTWAGVAAHLSGINVLLAILVTAGTLTRIFCEERALREQYPEYAAYAKNTRRVIPGIF
jgi:protein-S-isoprenylcysteine O-methyltransferase Ste14